MLSIVVSWLRTSIPSKCLKTYQLIWLFIQFCQCKKYVSQEIVPSEEEIFEKEKISDYLFMEKLIQQARLLIDYNVESKILVQFFKEYSQQSTLVVIDCLCDREEEIVACPKDAFFGAYLALSYGDIDLLNYCMPGVIEVEIKVPNNVVQLLENGLSHSHFLQDVKSKSGCENTKLINSSSGFKIVVRGERHSITRAQQYFEDTIY